MQILVSEACDISSQKLFTHLIKEQHGAINDRLGLSNDSPTGDIPKLILPMFSD